MAILHFTKESSKLKKEETIILSKHIECFLINDMKIRFFLKSGLKFDTIFSVADKASEAFETIYNSFDADAENGETHHFFYDCIIK